MRRIIRNPISDKICKQLKEKSKKKFKLSKYQRKEIEKNLFKSQKHLCCYCECSIDDTNKHIEHFLDQETNKDRIYDYNNMFLSCDGEKYSNNENNRQEIITCGHRKGINQNQVKINYDLLLNPADEETHSLFKYIDGLITPSKICSNKEKEKATYTIKMLSLDFHRLNNTRIEAITQLAKDLNLLTDNEKKLFIESVLDEDQESLPPFFSTLKDNFSFLLK
jgi:uncharacterized protein (TIGR02646 family)